MLAEVYTPESDPREVLARRDRGAVSVYARGRDYHDLVKKRLKRLGRWLVAETGAEIKVFVDTAPVMEKPLGQAAGLGWQGKHTNLVSRDLGSWFFLGELFLIAICLNYAVRLSRAGVQIKNLAQEVAILRARIDELGR